MKKKIHPKYHKEVKVVCSSCGNIFTVGGATVESMNVDYCNKCHPAFTGEKKVADTTSSIQRYKEREEQTKQLQKKHKDIKAKKAKQEKAKSGKAQKGPVTLKDILKDMKNE